MTKPSIPKGTRDFLPQEVVKRKYIFGVIEDVFKKYGYLPIETPAMENLSTLTGKYGEEGDKLLFKVLNNGDFLANADKDAIEALDSSKIIPSISKRGLRYDLTVPFARFVVMHQHEIQLPFKRYAIMPVWRADRPQRGRYQEFYQCDADVVGSDSLMNEAEILKIIDEVFTRLGIEVEIKINHRKLLQSISQINEFESFFTGFAVAIDKLDKIGVEGVKGELLKCGLTEAQVNATTQFMTLSSMEDLTQAVGNNETGRIAIDELSAIMSYLEGSPLKNTFTIDPTLARGLSYYTGCIIEVKAVGVQMGSITGGGRYDDLTANFGLSGTSGIGISFGAERIYDVMVEQKLFSEEKLDKLKLIFLAMDESSHRYAFAACMQVRQENIAADIYPEAAKLKKLLKYAADRKFPYAAIAGEQEREEGIFLVKNLETGEQEKLSLADLIDKMQ